MSGRTKGTDVVSGPVSSIDPRGPVPAAEAGRVTLAEPG